MSDKIERLSEDLIRLLKMRKITATECIASLEIAKMKVFASSLKVDKIDKPVGK